MRILIAEDDLASRKFMYKFLLPYGECDVTVDGREAIDAFMMAWDENKPYDLICLDIMMPNLDGKKALKAIREIEIQKGVEAAKRVKVIMTTALDDTKNVYESFDTGCEGYATKPIDTKKFIEVLQKLQLI
jgi:two-component system, chemotaxis family, chemotaxis protein CheY